MSAIFLPQDARDELDAETERDAAMGVGLAHGMKTALADIDPRLRIAFSKPGGDSDERVLEPGYWYFIRFDEHGGAPGYWRITEKGGLDGEFGDGYSHPEWEHLEALKRRDSWRHPRVWEEFAKRRRDSERAREKTKAELHREFREKLEERLAHLYRPQIAVTAAMKARADGENVMEGGVVLPGLIHERLDGRAAVRDMTVATVVDEEPTPPSPDGGKEAVPSPTSGETILPESPDSDN